MLQHYVLLAAVVFGVNLLPAFGPPTWAVLVFLRLEFDLAPAPMIAIGALSAAAGRLVLAHAARLARPHLSPRRRESLAAVQEALARRRSRSVAGLALFAASPVPSAQLFVAAGLMQVRLLPLTAAFFAGRLVSYSIYVGTASVAERGLGPVFEHWLRSPVGLGLEVLMVAALMAFVRIDWTRVFAKDAG